VQQLNKPEPPKAAAKKTKSKTQSKEAPPKKAAQEERKQDVIENKNERIYKLGKIELKATNISKEFFPNEGFTKGDVIDYYDRMADYILPYLKDRPESLFRTPNGIKQKGFFQKDAADAAPGWVDHIELYSESVDKEIDYILCNNKATLLYMANLGCIEINPWHSTTDALDHPDYLIIDIDPSDNNTFEHVIEAANVVKEVLEKAGANSICKTSGATGLHIYIPTGKQYTYEQVKDFAYLICMMANEALPKITTLERSLSKRSKDKIYMDYLQNRKGQTIASVYSLRPKPGATVSTPLKWEEVKSGLHPHDFNIHTIEKRLKDVGDLFGDVLRKPIDLIQCIENLEG
jgi:bifunctional non-homologous end joining protein LigD